MLSISVEPAMGLPLFTSATSLLLDTINYSMAVFISKIFFQRAPVFLVTFMSIFGLTFLAPNSQSVLSAAIFAELALVFDLFAFAASLHLYILYSSTVR
jgi:hypothetical protein